MFHFSSGNCKTEVKNKCPTIEDESLLIPELSEKENVLVDNDISDPLTCNVDEDPEAVCAEVLGNIVNLVMYDSNLSTTDMSQQEIEISELKLQLNQCQQMRASLELQLRQKEEIIIKAHSETQQCKQENKLLREKLDATLASKDDDIVKKLNETVEKMKAKEERLLDHLNKLSTDEDGFK